MFHHISHTPIEYGPGVSIFCFGDLQFGLKGFDEEAWNEFKHEFKSTPCAYGLGLGDYEDWLRPSMRGRIESAIVHDDSAKQQLDDKIRRDQDSLLKKMSFLEGKLIGLHQGHHDWRFNSGEFSSQRIASALRAPFLGWVASTRLCLKMRLKSTDGISRGYSYTIVSTHGSSNARFTSTSTKWLENSLVHGFLADQYVMGHACKSANWTPNEYRIVRREGPPGTINTTPRCLMVGGFHNGFTNGHESTYVERSGFLPQPVMWGLIRIKLSHKRELMAKRGINSTALDVENVNRGPAR